MGKNGEEASDMEHLQKTARQIQAEQTKLQIFEAAAGGPGFRDHHGAGHCAGGPRLRGFFLQRLSLQAGCVLRDVPGGG